MASKLCCDDVRGVAISCQTNDEAVWYEVGWAEVEGRRGELQKLNKMRWFGCILDGVQ